MDTSQHAEEYRELRERLREARKTAGLTQVQVAEVLRKPQSFVSKIETGERRIDPVELLWLVEIYRCELVELLFEL